MKDTQQGSEISSTNDVELNRKPCCCGQSKTGFCDGTHLNMKSNNLQPQQFQHPFGDDNVLNNT